MTDQDDGEINPFEAPSPDPLEPPEPQTPSSRIDYPGGMWSVLPAGIICGLLVGLIFIGVSFGASADNVIPLVILIWCGAFAGLGIALPGSAGRKASRACVGVLLSLPAAVLYVPVCAVTYMVTESAGTRAESQVMVFASIVAFTSVLGLFALLIRRIARLSDKWVPNRFPDSDENRDR